MQCCEVFFKDIDKYSFFSMFGYNVFIIEVQIWRLYWKVMSVSFNEKNVVYIFFEVIYQICGMLDEFFGVGGEIKGMIKIIIIFEYDIMIWVLNVIGYVGFGFCLLWLNQKMFEDIDFKLVKYGSLDFLDGYFIIFVKLVEWILDKIIIIFVFFDFFFSMLFIFWF